MKVLVFITVLLFVPLIYGQSSNEESKESRYPDLPESVMRIVFADIYGADLRIADLRGRVVRINLWATWAGPSRDQIPVLVRLQKHYDRRDFEVVGVNVGDSEGNAEDIRLVKKHGDRYDINYTLVSCSAPTILEFYSITKQQVIPQSILIDRDGRLRAFLSEPVPGYTRRWRKLSPKPYSVGKLQVHGN